MYYEELVKVLEFNAKLGNMNIHEVDLYNKIAEYNLIKTISNIKYEDHEDQTKCLKILDEMQREIDELVEKVVNCYYQDVFKGES